MPKNKKNKQKHLCKYSKKEVEANLLRLSELVRNPIFICTKCARVTSVDELLCQPKTL